MAEMTEHGYREQAIKDVAKNTDLTVDIVRNAVGYSTQYAVSQRERVLRLEKGLRESLRKSTEHKARVLRLEDALRNCIHELSAHEGYSDTVKEFSAALASKEGQL